MKAPFLALVFWLALPSGAEPAKTDAPPAPADFSTLLTELSESSVDDHAKLCAQARTTTREAGLEGDALAKFRAECPSWFPLPATPDFCRTIGCASDFSWR